MCPPGGVGFFFFSSATPPHLLDRSATRSWPPSAASPHLSGHYSQHLEQKQVEAGGQPVGLPQQKELAATGLHPDRFPGQCNPQAPRPKSREKRWRKWTGSRPPGEPLRPQVPLSRCPRSRAQVSPDREPSQRLRRVDLFPAPGLGSGAGRSHVFRGTHGAGNPPCCADHWGWSSPTRQPPNWGSTTWWPAIRSRTRPEAPGSGKR